MRVMARNLVQQRLSFAGRETCDAVTEFDCTQMSSSNCISLTSVCDGRRDCHNGEDENATMCAGRLQHSQFTSSSTHFMFSACLPHCLSPRGV